MKAIVLAAGKGKRLQSEKFNSPKVLREAKGRALLSYVLDNISFIPQEDTVIVVGYKREMVIEKTKGNYKFATQEEQLGTGHAVASAREYFENYDGNVIVLYGDMPMLKKDTYAAMVKQHEESGADCTFLTAISESPLAYGRIIRENGKIVDIVEQKDCNAQQLAIKELNVGVYVFNSKALFENLSKLKNDNAQGEYYLTDVPKLFIADGMKVDSYTIGDTCEIYGVNTMEDLEFCEKNL
ncbi:MAG: NTP transferase domain-containing protein [Oscillospiraceae bacterium]|nr:NTP transferase domain-containing protein [Oscillospiraceae bacterium]